MKKRKWLIAIVLVVLMMLPAASASAALFNDDLIASGESVADDVTIFGNEFEIETGGTLEGSLLVFGGHVTVDGTVEEDVYLYGGNTVINGTIERDLVIYGGTLSLSETAELDGDCVLVGGNLDTSAAADVACVRNPVGGLVDGIDGFRGLPVTIETGQSWFGAFFTDVAQTIGLTITMGILALAVASVFPNQLSRVGSAVRQKPVASGTVGLLTAIAVPSVGAALLLISVILTVVCIGIIGYPIVFAIFAGLIGAGVLGWITIGQLTGYKIAGWLSLNQNHLPTTAVIGTVVLTFLAGLLDALPLPGIGLVIALLSFVGLGAAALTKFGTRPYPLIGTAKPSADINFPSD